MVAQENIVSPFLRRGTDVRGMMTGMMIALCLIAAHFSWRYDSGYFMRFVFYLALGGALDLLYTLLKSGRAALPRASTFVTVALLSLSVPAHMPWWQVGVGCLVAVWFGKLMVDPAALRLNPMLLGRLFMMIVFSDSIQAWLAPGTEIDALTSATPLGMYAAEGQIYSPLRILAGSIGGDWEGIYALIPGSPGEVFPPLTLICGIVLYALGIVDWRPGAAFCVGFALLCAMLGMPIVFHMIAGSIFFTAVFIVSDPRSMPGSKAGRLLAGLLAGMINAVLRWHGYLPEGVVPAVLAVNLLAPTLDRMAFVMRGWHNRFCTATRSQIVF